MSRENVEIVLGMQPPPEVDHVRFFRSDDLAGVAFAAFEDRFHPDFQTTGTLLGEEMVSAGPDGCRALLMKWYEPWASYRIESHDAIDLGDRVLVKHTAFGRLAGSDAEVKLTGATVYTFRDGRIARIAFYVDSDEALEAVGLER